MNKHIKLFYTEEERTAWEESLFYRPPYISLSEDTGRVDYLSKWFVSKEDAKVGDIVFAN